MGAAGVVVVLGSAADRRSAGRRDLQHAIWRVRKPATDFHGSTRINHKRVLAAYPRKPGFIRGLILSTPIILSLPGRDHLAVEVSRPRGSAGRRRIRLSQRRGGPGHRAYRKAGR